MCAVCILRPAFWLYDILVFAHASLKHVHGRVGQGSHAIPRPLTNRFPTVPALDHLFALCLRRYDRRPIKATSKELTYEVSDSFAAFLSQDVLPMSTHRTPRFLDGYPCRWPCSVSIGAWTVLKSWSHAPATIRNCWPPIPTTEAGTCCLQLRCGDALVSLYDVIFVNNTVFDLNKVEGGLTSQILSKIATTMFVRPCLIISTKPLGLLNGARSRPIRVPLAAQHASFCNNSVLQTIYLQTVQPLWDRTGPGMKVTDDCYVSLYIIYF
jgi:hypothetical protein